jgi:hypothetical protein
LKLFELSMANFYEMAATKEAGGGHSMMTLPRCLRVVSPSLFIVLVSACGVVGQTETATVSGLVTDRTAAAVSGAEVRLQSVERGTVTTTTTNNAGIYVFPSVYPGQYQISVQKQGFRQIDLLGLIVNVQDHIEQNFRLQIGSVAESVTVNANDLHIDTTDATVSTVVDRQFAENLPMNGRSFQSLIDLTPGVVVTSSSGLDPGQFSVNGQRGSSNYWMVDGVSANVGSSAIYGQNGTTGGVVGTTSAFGGTNSLVSVDALQEFRIQTSTYAPEFGRTPGGQISIVTRSGTNQFHGSAFDYLRNDAFDANNWFNGVNILNPTPLRKAQERQNDFGGTLGGPILKDKTFFFFSYEGLRLRLPQTALTTVPDLNARNSAISAMKPYLNAYPLPNGTDNPATGAAEFNASFSDPASLDAYSLRIDHRWNDKLSLFGRYNYSPSEIAQQGGASNVPLNDTRFSRFTIQTATVGSTWLVSEKTSNELRFNYSRTNAAGQYLLSNFGGAVPLTSLPFPSPFTSQNAEFGFFIAGLSQGNYLAGKQVGNLQRQINLVDNISVQKGSHNLKVGADYRHLSPIYAPFLYSQIALFRNVASAESGTLRRSSVQSNAGVTFLLNNLGVFAQDTWRVVPRLTVTYGLRWDVDFAPTSAEGPTISAVTGFNLNDLSQLALAPAGTRAFNTPYANVAPRLGVAYQLSQNQDLGTVVRGGFGVFYDLATSSINSINVFGYPFNAIKSNGGTFPLDPTTAAPPQIVPPDATNQGGVTAFDPNLKLPYTLEWNFALEQSLGKQQTLTASYIGSAGRRLIQTAQIFSPNPNFGRATLVANSARSDYDALQVQFQRRLSRGLQALASYTWSHSIDTASAGSFGNASNFAASGMNANANRGPSDFDIRNGFSGAVTYAVPSPKLHPFINAITKGWSLQTIVQARSAPPVDIFNGNFSQITNGFAPNIRPDVVPGIPFYLYGPQYPGGKIVNNTPGSVTCPDGTQNIGPFCDPPNDPSGNPLRQGNLGRNALRGFGATQWDFAVHREFPIHESLSLQFRAEMFNVLNHPNFAPPVGDLSDPRFGLSKETLGQFLGGGNLGGGGLSPLYQIGGPRSMQFALKLSF